MAGRWQLGRAVTKIVTDPEEEVVIDSDAVVIGEEGENEVISSGSEENVEDSPEGEEGDVALADESGEE